MSHHSMISELHRFPVLKRQIDEVTGQFLRENLQPAESIIAHIIEMEVCLDGRALPALSLAISDYVSIHCYVTPWEV